MPNKSQSPLASKSKIKRPLPNQDPIGKAFDEAVKKVEFEKAVEEFMLNRKLLDQKQALKKHPNPSVVLTKYGEYVRIETFAIVEFLNEAYDKLGIEDYNEFSDWIVETQQYVFDAPVDKERESERVKALKFLRTMNNLMNNMFTFLSTSVGEELLRPVDH